MAGAFAGGNITDGSSAGQLLQATAAATDVTRHDWDLPAQLPAAASASSRGPQRLPIWTVVLICALQAALLYAYLTWRSIKERIAQKQQLRDMKSQANKE